MLSSRDRSVTDTRKGHHQERFVRTAHRQIVNTARDDGIV